MNITILGSGIFGLALANSFKENNCHVTIWSKIESELTSNKAKYPYLDFEANLEKALAQTNLIVITIPLPYLTTVATELKKYYQNQDIIIASKGIDIKTQMFAYEIINTYLNTSNIGVISGGSFAEDMLKKQVMGLTLGTTSKKIKEKIQKSLANEFIKIEYSTDLIGISICGAVKNVIAIGFGILNGADYSESTKFLYLTKAIQEVKDLIQELNGNPKTILSYAGIDDIIMTSTSSKSRNYTLGQMIGQNISKEKIETYKHNTTIEGLGTSKAIYLLAQKNNLNIPLLSLIYKILYENKNYHEIINYLKKD